MRKRYNLEMAILELTNRCNLNCMICGSDSKNKINPSELSIQEWRNIVDDMANLDIKRIVLSGGEPTLKVGIGDLIKHIAEKRIEWGMVSNGLYFSPDLLTLFWEYKPYAIGLSVDGIAETHNRLRGNPQSFQKIIKNIKKLQKKEIPISIITTVHKLNWQELPEMARFVLENKIYGWQIQLAMPFGRMKQNKNFLLSQKDFLQVCLLVEEFRKTLNFVNVAAADCFAWAPAGKIRSGKWAGCSAGINSLGIDALGNVRGCLSMTECPPEGNARKRKISEIWKDSTLFSYNRNFRLENTSESCQKCDKVLICRGGCNSQSFSMSGKFQQGVYCWYRETKTERREKRQCAT